MIIVYSFFTVQLRDIFLRPEYKNYLYQHFIFYTQKNPHNLFVKVNAHIYNICMDSKMSTIQEEKRRNMHALGIKIIPKIKMFAFGLIKTLYMDFSIWKINLCIYWKNPLNLNPIRKSQNLTRTRIKEIQPKLGAKKLEIKPVRDSGKNRLPDLMQHSNRGKIIYTCFLVH